MSAEDRLDDLAGSVSDGRPIDWDAAEREGRAPGEDPSIRALRDVARIADFNRELQRSALAETLPAENVQSGARNVVTEPKRWGDLTLLELIGSGASGEVWRAWDSTLQREVALKFLQTLDPATENLAQAQLVDEARALARVRHRNVVTVHGIAMNENRAGMWMECLQGVTLAREIERGAMSIQQVASIGLELCAALQALDSAGLVHRDIKPANIVLEAEGRVVLTDFGLGWRPALDEGAAPRASGTPLFMAPELLSGGIPSHQSDLYALGVTLWWALAGQSPYRATTLQELKDEIAAGLPSSLEMARPDAPRALVTAIEWAMRPAAAERPRSATHLRERLRFGTSVATPGVVSIAVLPFVNRGHGEEDDYFSEGLADELLNVLAKVRGLKVAAGTSSSQFKGRKEDLGVIGQRLNVATILDGSVRKSGSRVRIAVQLVNVADGYHLWSEIYDRTLDDIFAVQDDIAQSVVRELRVRLMGRDPSAGGAVSVDVAAAARGRGESAEAHRLYLQGRHFGGLGSAEHVAKGIACVLEAIKLDPSHALAWAWLARAYSYEAGLLRIPVAEGVGKAREAVQRALTLEPNLAEAHSTLGSIRMRHDWDWEGAEASCRRALDLSPGSADVVRAVGVLARSLDRKEEAIQLHRQVVEQDPLSASSYASLGLSYWTADRLPEAEAAFRMAQELAPQRVVIRSQLGLVLMDEGRIEDGLAEANQEPLEEMRLFALAAIYSAGKRRAESDRALRELIEKYSATDAYQIAEAHAARGEVGAAFEWLERAYLQRDLGLPHLRADPLFRPLHGPQWKAFLVRIGFEKGATPSSPATQRDVAL